MGAGDHQPGAFHDTGLSRSLKLVRACDLPLADGQLPDAEVRSAGEGANAWHVKKGLPGRRPCGLAQLHLLRRGAAQRMSRIL